MIRGDIQVPPFPWRGDIGIPAGSDLLPSLLISRWQSPLFRGQRSPSTSPRFMPWGPTRLHGGVVTSGLGLVFRRGTKGSNPFQSYYLIYLPLWHVSNKMPQVRWLWGAKWEQAYWPNWLGFVMNVWAFVIGQDLFVLYWVPACHPWRHRGRAGKGGSSPWPTPHSRPGHSSLGEGLPLPFVWLPSIHPVIVITKKNCRCHPIAHWNIKIAVLGETPLIGYSLSSDSNRRVVEGTRVTLMLHAKALFWHTTQLI